MAENQNRGWKRRDAQADGELVTLGLVPGDVTSPCEPLVMSNFLGYQTPNTFFL